MKFKTLWTTFIKYKPLWNIIKTYVLKWAVLLCFGSSEQRSLFCLPLSFLPFLPSFLPHPSFFLLCLQLFLCTNFPPYSPWSCLIPSIFLIFYFLILIFSWVYCDKPLKYFILKYFKEVCTFHVLSLSFHWLCKPFNWFFLLPHQYAYQWCSMLPKCIDIFFCFISLSGVFDTFPFIKRLSSFAFEDTTVFSSSLFFCHLLLQIFFFLIQK